MNTLISWLESPAAERLGWVLVHSLWQLALLAGIYLLVRRLLWRSPAATRYFAACAIMACMVLVLPLTALLVVTGPQAAGSASPAGVASQVTALPATPSPGGTSITKSEGPVLAPATAVPDVPTVQADSAPPSESLVIADQAASWKERLSGCLVPALPWIVMAWLAGVLALAVRQLGGWIMLRRLCGTGTEPVDEILTRKSTTIAKRLGVQRVVRLLSSVNVAVPSVIGHFKPVILFPASLISGLSPQQIEAILAHELAHIRRHDYLVNLVQVTCETVLFYHPAVWWISREIRHEREHCCDDLAVQVCGRVAYARTLAMLEERRAPLSIAAMAATGGSLLQRIRRIVGQPAAARTTRSTWLAGALVALSVCVILPLAIATGSGAADDFDFDDPPMGYEKKIRMADANHQFRAGGLRFKLSDVTRSPDGTLEASLGLKDGYEIVSFRLFDHPSRKLVHDSNWQLNTDNDASTRKFHATRIGETARIQIKETEGSLPEQMDLWLRLVENGPGERVLIPARQGASGKAGKSEVVVTSLLAGRMNGRGEQHLPGKEMLWDRSTIHDQDSSITLNMENRGDVLRGRYSLVVVKKDGTRHPNDRFFQFSAGRKFNYARFDVAMADLDHLELIPFKAKHKFFFNGVVVPGVKLPELSAKQRREVERLVKRAGSRDESERDAVVASLVAIGPGVAPEMIPLLWTGKTDVVGVRVLGELAPDPAVQRLLIGAIEEARESSQHPNTIYCALIALGKSGNATHADFIAGFIKAHDIAAMSALAELGGDQARDHLLGAFDVVPTARWFMLANRLREVGDPSALPELRNRLAQVELPPNDRFPNATVSAITEAIAALSGEHREFTTTCFAQGQHFRYPFAGPGLPKTFSVNPPQDHFVRLPKADPQSVAGREAIWGAMEEATAGPGFTIDGNEVVVFHGLKLAPLWSEGAPYPTTLYDWLRRTSHQELGKLVDEGRHTGRYVIPGNGLLVALDPAGRIDVLSLKKTSDDFTYDVTVMPQDPSMQLIPIGKKSEELRFTEVEGCTLHDLESETKDGALNLSRGHLETMTEDKWNGPPVDALLTVEFASGEVGLGVPGAERFLLVEDGKNGEAAGKILALLKGAATGQPEVPGHRVVARDGALFHQFSELKPGRMFAFAVKMPSGMPIAGVLEIKEIDWKAETVQIHNRFLPTAAAREVFAKEEQKPPKTAARRAHISREVATGRAVDAETGAAVEKFVIQDRLPMSPQYDGPPVFGGETRSVGGFPDGRFPIRALSTYENGKLVEEGQGECRLVADGYLSEHVVVPADHPSGEVFTVRLRRGNMIRGRVLDHTGKPVAGAGIYLSNGQRVIELTENPHSEIQEPSARTDEDGHFEMSGGGEDNQSLFVTAPSLFAWRADLPQPGREATIRLPEPAKLRIRYDIKGAPIKAQARIELRTWDMPKWKGAVNVERWVDLVVGKDGLLIGNLPPGVYDISRIKHLRTAASGTDAMLDRNLELTLESGKTAETNFVRPVGAPISGEIVGLPDENVDGVFVYVKPVEASGDPLGEADWKLPVFDGMALDGNGKFTSERIAPGEYKIIATAYRTETPAERGSTGWRLPAWVGSAIVTVPETGEPPRVRMEMKPYSAHEKTTMAEPLDGNGNEGVVGQPVWGDATEGVQVRLRADKVQWQTGEQPKLLTDFRNNGQADLRLVLAPEWWELELDGQWYRVTNPNLGEVEVKSFGPHVAHENIWVPLEDRWGWKSKEGNKPLVFGPGKHKVRVAFEVHPAKAGEGKSVRAVSNPVEIEILPADAKPAAPPATVSFGPVIEQVVNHTGNDCLIDLDSGQLVTAPMEAFKDGAKSAMEWTAEHGVDAGGNAGEAGRGLIGFDMIAVPVSGKSWEGVAAYSLREMVTSGKPGNPVYLSAGPTMPTTFLFATREGGMGVLQITGFTDKPRGVKIRYKLVQAEEDSSAAPPPATITIAYQSETMQNIIGALLPRECSARLCLENLDFDMAKDGVTIEQAVGHLEGVAKKRKLTPMEQARLSSARKMLAKGNPKTMLFDVGTRYSGQFHATSVDELLTQIIRGTPYAWRKIGDTYVVLPAVGSRLAYPVTLSTKGLTVRQAVEKVVEQRPAGSTITMPISGGWLGSGDGADRMPWLSAQAPDLELKGIPALEALCRITEGARPDSVWELAGYKDSRDLGILRGPNGAAATSSIPPAAPPSPDASFSDTVERILGLSKAPHTSDYVRLPDLFEERPAGSKSYEFRGGVIVSRHPKDFLFGDFYYLPDKDLFYVQHDLAGSSTRTYYGPFKGRPWDVLGVPEMKSWRNEPWGETVKGLQVRLRANKTVWQAGEVPTFQADVRNQTKQEYGIARDQQLCGLDLDGQKYQWIGEQNDAKISPFPPGREYNDIAITLGAGWQSTGTNNPLALSPGKHTLRVIFYLHGWGNLRIDPIIFESNPVEFSVEEQRRHNQPPGARPAPGKPN